MDATKAGRPTSIRSVVRAHFDNAVAIYSTRVTMLSSPSTALHSLRRNDERLAAVLDGLALAAPLDDVLGSAREADPQAAWLFVETICALNQADRTAIGVLLDSASSDEAHRKGIVSAFGWTPASRLGGLVKSLLDSTVPAVRRAGLESCAMHRVDPGFATRPWLREPDAAVRSRALRTAGEIGYRDGLTRCVGALGEDDANVRFWAAWSAVLLGDRNRALRVLTADATTASAHRARAFRLALQTLPVTDAHAILKTLARDPKDIRWLIRGSGIAGDPTYVSWLINHMSNPPLARLAGEAFTLITGVDLDAQQIWGPRPENVESGPSDDPEDENVDMDPDEGLSWPDVKKVEGWWAKNDGRFQKGQRYFLGQPVSRGHCVDVLKHGYQRQRILAAHYLSLLEPGTPLFNTSAPAWRQQRRLATL